jgi:FKBP-type peptidyl-prolyl cis-trans isomerase SlpA
LTLHYRLAGPQGQDVINTFDGKPATLSLGTGELSPAMESRLLGLPERAPATTFDLPAGAAFGERNPDMLQWVARKLLTQLGDPTHEPTRGRRGAVPHARRQGQLRRRGA